MADERLVGWYERSGTRVYLQSLGAQGAGQLCITAGLVVLGAVVEGFGILLLVPILGVVFAGGGVLPRWAQAMLRLTGMYGPGAQVAVLLATVLLLAAVRSVVLWRRDARLAAQSWLLVDGWRSRLVAALSRASWPVLTGLRRSRFEHAITAEVGRLSVGSDQALRALGATLQVIVQIAVALWLSPWLAFAAITLGAALLPLARRALRSAHRYGRLLTTAGNRRQGALTEFVAGLKLAKAHDATDRYAGDYLAESRALRDRAIAYASARAFGRNIFQFTAVIVAAALLLIGVRVLHTGPAVLSAFMVLLARLSAPTLSLVQGMQSVATMLPAVNELASLEQQLLAGAEATSQSACGCQVKGPAAVTLRMLTYRYPNADHYVLQSLSRTFGAGQTIAVIGHSGSGKTTLVDIVLGLICPTSGTVEVDGEPIRSATALARWRSEIGYVPQDAFLFDTTIGDNLRWAAPDASEVAIWRALEEASAADFVRALPEGLSTRVGDRGLRLSGGERQRICLARALLRSPRLLVLDEATNAVDEEAEKRLLAALRKLSGKVTILFVAHRVPRDLKIDQTLRLDEKTSIIGRQDSGTGGNE